MDTGAEELAHIEMLATMIARLLDGAPVGDLEKAAKIRCSVPFSEG